MICQNYGMIHGMIWFNNYDDTIRFYDCIFLAMNGMINLYYICIMPWAMIWYQGCHFKSHDISYPVLLYWSSCIMWCDYYVPLCGYSMQIWNEWWYDLWSWYDTTQSCWCCAWFRNAEVERGDVLASRCSVRLTRVVACGVHWLSPIAARRPLALGPILNQHWISCHFFCRVIPCDCEGSNKGLCKSILHACPFQECIFFFPSFIQPARCFLLLPAMPPGCLVFDRRGMAPKMCGSRRSSSATLWCSREAWTKASSRLLDTIYASLSYRAERPS